jgi:hypothetical protein
MRLTDPSAADAGSGTHTNIESAQPHRAFEVLTGVSIVSRQILLGQERPGTVLHSYARIRRELQTPETSSCWRCSQLSLKLLLSENKRKTERQPNYTSDIFSDLLGCE